MTPEVVTLFILNTLFFLFATIAFVIALKIHKRYNKNATTQEQYKLERESYLGATIIKYVFFIKIPLFIFFIFTLEKIALILPGAMCATGVVNATDSGIYLLLFKVINLYLFAYWLVLNAQDAKDELSPYMRLKFQLFVVLYLLFVSEIVLESLFFFSMDVKEVVDCCGVVFSSSNGTYMAAIVKSPFWLQASFLYAFYLFMFLAYLFQSKRVFSLLNALFVFVALVTLIGSFGTYVYELPTHHCPFCLLAYEYNYVGYLLYSLLFLGTFSGVVLGFVSLSEKAQREYFRASLILNLLYIFIVSSYVLLYYFKNSVLL